jgi:hypothetical protein
MSTISPPASASPGARRRRRSRTGPIARHDDLTAAALQRVEDAEHLALRLAAAGEELDVIEQQQIDALVQLLERFPVAGEIAMWSRSTKSSSGTYSTTSSGCSCLAANPMAPIRCVLPRPDGL